MKTADLMAELKTLANKTRSVDPGTARRLEELGQILRGSDRDRKATLDLYGAINPFLVEEAAFDHYQRRPFFLSLLEWGRNALVLFPITLTWYGLWHASVSYEALIRQNEDLITQPFLLLWQQGFAQLDSYTGPTFSQVALWDSIMLFAVFALTVLVHYFTDVQGTVAERKSRALRQDLESVLWEVEQVFAERRHNQSQGVTFAQFEESSRELVELMEGERERLEQLAQQKEQELGDISGLRDGMVTSAEELKNFSETVHQTYEPLQQNIQQLSMSVRDVGRQQAQLLKATQDLGQQMGKAFGPVIAASDALEHTADGLELSATSISAYAGALEADIQGVQGLFEDIARRIDSVTENLEGATGNAGTLSQDMTAMMEALTKLSGQFSNSIETATASLDRLARDLYPRFEGHSQEMDRVAQRMGQVAAELERSGQSTQSAFSDLQSSAGHFSDYADQADQAMRNLHSITQGIDRAGNQLVRAFDNTTKTSEQLAQMVSSMNRASGPASTRDPAVRVGVWAIVVLLLVNSGAAIVGVLLQFL